MDEIRELMKVRDCWRKLARRSGDPNAWTEYKNLRREVKREIRLAEREYIVDQQSRDDRTVANEFNRLFTSVGQETVDKINLLASPCDYDH